MRRFTLLVFCIFPAFVAAVSSAEPPTVKIGVCLSLSGDLEESGKKALAGVRLRLDDYNANRSADQPLLELAVYDDRGKPEEAARGVRHLAGVEGVPAIIGPLSTNIMLGMRDAAAELGVVVLSPSVTSSRIGKNRDWTCRLLFDDDFQGVALARFLAQRQRMTNAAAILNSRFSYAVSVFKAFKAEFERLGGTVVAEEYYDWSPGGDGAEYDFSSIIEKVARSNPDVVLLPDYSAEVAAIIRCSTRLRAGLRFCGGDT